MAPIIIQHIQLVVVKTEHPRTRDHIDHYRSLHLCKEHFSSSDPFWVSRIDIQAPVQVLL
jgi:hypothetical protein